MELLEDGRAAMRDERKLDHEYLTAIKLHAYQSPTKYKCRLAGKLRKKTFVYRKQELMFDLTKEASVEEIVDVAPARAPLNLTIRIDDDPPSPPPARPPRALHNLAAEAETAAPMLEVLESPSPAQAAPQPAPPIARALRTETDRLIEEHRRLLEGFVGGHCALGVEPVPPEMNPRICKKTAGSLAPAEAEAGAPGPSAQKPSPQAVPLRDSPGAVTPKTETVSPAGSREAQPDSPHSAAPPSEARREQPVAVEAPRELSPSFQPELMEHFSAIAICFQRPLSEVKRLYRELGSDLARVKRHIIEASSGPTGP